MRGRHDAGRRDARRAGRAAGAAARGAGAVSADRHREAARLCAWPAARVLRSPGRAGDRPRCRGQQLPLVVADCGHREESSVPDAGRGRKETTDDIPHMDRSLPRRTVLRGLGASLSLPLLEAMLPAFSARASGRDDAAHRFLAFYVPNGMAMEYWTPKGEGRAFELSPILEPLAPFRNQMLVLSRHQRQLELHPRRRLRVVPDRHDARRAKRSRDPGRRLDGPVAREALRQRDAGGAPSSSRWMLRPTPAPARAS